MLSLRRLIKLKLFMLPWFLMGFLLAFPPNAYAYLDPGTGSYVFQMSLAFLAGAMYALKIYWTKIISYIINFFSKEKK